MGLGVGWGGEAQGMAVLLDKRHRRLLEAFLSPPSAPTPPTSLIPAANAGTWVRSLGQEDPLEKEMATHSSILAWRAPMDRGAWWAIQVHGVTKSRLVLND